MIPHAINDEVAHESGQVYRLKLNLLLLLLGEPYLGHLERVKVRPLIEVKHIMIMAASFLVQ